MLRVLRMDTYKAATCI